MTAWASERQAIENMIDTFGTGFFACVMDSYDYAEVGRTPSTCRPPMRGYDRCSCIAFEVLWCHRCAVGCETDEATAY